ncbi:MAG: hypothetical protein HY804_07950 [Nitrospinae bacterium]|nr:hypothetical protein [Nitrospinota bacterium]
MTVTGHLYHAHAARHKTNALIKPTQIRLVKQPLSFTACLWYWQHGTATLLQPPGRPLPLAPFGEGGAFRAG